VLNFEGQLLSIEDSAQLLVAEADPDAQIVVVICRDGDRQVGFVVSHVLDVAAGTDLFEAGSSRATKGVTLLENRVTDLVDLALVPALSANTTEAHSCQFAEASL
jgi:hypothetical protein